jgi:hypothetical protein
MSILSYAIVTVAATALGCLLGTLLFPSAADDHDHDAHLAEMGELLAGIKVGKRVNRIFR